MCAHSSVLCARTLFPCTRSSVCPLAVPTTARAVLWCFPYRTARTVWAQLRRALNTEFVDARLVRVRAALSGAPFSNRGCTLWALAQRTPAPPRRQPHASRNRHAAHTPAAPRAAAHSYHEARRAALPRCNLPRARQADVGPGQLETGTARRQGADLLIAPRHLATTRQSFTKNPQKT